MKNKMMLSTIYSTLTALVILTFFACARGPYNRGMGTWDHMMGYAGGFMWLIVPVVVGVVIYFVVQGSKSRDFTVSATETPLDILKSRYAKGEIDKEEFNKKKKELEI